MPHFLLVAKESATHVKYQVKSFYQNKKVPLAPKKTSPNNFSLNLLTAHWVKYYAEYKSVRNSEFFIKNSSNILRNPAHTIRGANLRKIIRRGIIYICQRQMMQRSCWSVTQNCQILRRLTERNAEVAKNVANANEVKGATVFCGAII